MSESDQPRTGFTHGEPVRTRVRVHDGSDQAQRLRVLVDTLNQHTHMHTARITVVETRGPGAGEAMYVPVTPLPPRSVRVLPGPPSAATHAVPVPEPAAGAAPAASAALRARVLAVASGKGGVGKTNLAVNLCVALARQGRRAMLVDADMGVANADVLCGLSPLARLDAALAPALRGAPRRTLADLAVDAPGGFRLVPGMVAGVRNPDADPALRQRLIDGLADLDAASDVLVLDAPAGVGPTVLACLHVADRALVVATPEPTSIADAYALIKSFHLASGDGPGRAGGDARAGGEAARADLRVQLVVNQAADEREALRVHERIAAVARRFLKQRVPLAGWIPADAHVPQAVRAREPLLVRYPRSAAARAAAHLADDVAVSLGLPVRSPAPPRVSRGFVRRLLGL